MELYIKDRFYIPQMLPQQGKFTEFNLKRGIIAKIAITAKDREVYSIREHPEDGKIEWDSKKDLECPLTVDFSKEEIDYLKKSCENLVETAYPDEFWLTVEKIYDAANVLISCFVIYRKDVLSCVARLCKFYQLMAYGLLKPPKNLVIDFKPSPKQYELWRLLQPDYCPHCGGSIEQVLTGHDRKGNPQYKPQCVKCNSQDLPQLILGGGAAGKRLHCQPSR